MRADKRQAFILTTATLFACAALLSGCSTPRTGPGVIPIVPPPWVGRTSPENVLQTVENAYVWMNATNYLDCLSEDFEFFPTEDDVQDPDLDIPPVWYKTDEWDLHENMFDEGSNIESIALTTTIVSLVTDVGIPEDPLDDTCTCQVDVDLRVSLLTGLTYLATEPSQFIMRVDTDQTGPNGELLWEVFSVVRSGSAPAGPVKAARESAASWGAIKSMYR